ncbi:MAG: SCO family protein [Planctomycetes bacterium]|nr:SCO family protein [Planctomycetota bacterium]
MHHPRTILTNIARIALAATVIVGASVAQLNIEGEMSKGVEIVEKLGEKLPLDLQFIDDRGEPKTLASFFGKGHPVIVTMNYADCPMLCKLQLTGFIDALKGLSLEPGKDFEIVTVSLDTEETRMRAQDVKRAHLAKWGNPEGESAWHWLRALPSQTDNVKKLADAMGFGYKRDPRSGDYSHLACLMLASPDGVLTRYLYGIQFPESTLRLAIVEAGRGEVGSTADKVLLWCFAYDSTTGRYTPALWRIMRIGGLLTVAFLAFLFFGFRKRSPAGRDVRPA